MKTIDLRKFTTIEGTVEYAKILDKYSKQTVNILKSPSVSPRSGRPSRKTPYYLGWEAHHTKLRQSEKVTVWNRTNWQLTHLLENGHFITNRKSGIGWSAPRPHIYPTYRKVEPQFVRAMERAEVNIDIK